MPVYTCFQCFDEIHPVRPIPLPLEKVYSSAVEREKPKEHLFECTIDVTPAKVLDLLQRKASRILQKVQRIVVL